MESAVCLRRPAPRAHIAVGMTAGVVLLSPVSAKACTECAVAFGDLLLPPIGAWTLLAFLWFYALSKCKYVERRPVLMPSRKVSSLLLFGAFLLAIFGGGPLPFLLFLIPCLAMSMQVICSNAGKEVSAFPRSARIVAGMGLVAFAILSASAVRIHAARSPADFVLKWGLVAPSLDIIGDLASRGTEAVPELRRVLLEGDDGVKSATLDRISSRQEPEWSMPLLIEVLEKRKEEAGVAQDVRRVMEKLSGIALTESAGAAEWRDAWGNSLGNTQLSPPAPE